MRQVGNDIEYFIRLRQLCRSQAITEGLARVLPGSKKWSDPAAIFQVTAIAGVETAVEKSHHLEFVRFREYAHDIPP